MISDDFYKRYQRYLSSTPIFSNYIRWVYKKTNTDIKQLNLQSNYNNVLLCGTCGEITSLLFVKNILSINPKAHITILDYGEAQVQNSKLAIEKKYPNADVQYIVSDARSTIIEDQSIDYIDTDYMFEYFNKEGLDELFKEWKRILNPSGLITFRAFAVQSTFSKFLHWIMVDVYCGFFLKSNIFMHSKKTIQSIIIRNGYKFYIKGRALFPFGYRYLVHIK